MLGYAAIVIGAGLLAAGAFAPDDPLAYVDPFIGTRNRGNTSPAAVLPFGMASFGPETTRGDTVATAAPGGYQYDSRRIRGFSLTRLSATGCRGASGDVPFMPITRAVDRSPAADKHDGVYASDFSHRDELARPGDYRVTMESGVTAELAATARTGLGRFTYPADETARMLVRTSHSQVGSGDAHTEIELESRTISGWVRGGNFCGYLDPVNRRDYYTLYFTARFDAPFRRHGGWEDGELLPGATETSGGTGYGENGVPPYGRGSGVWVELDPGEDRQVQVRVGISYVSLENARRNLDAEQGGEETVEELRSRAQSAWRSVLGKIRISGGTPAHRTVFYTALYHTQLHPNLFSDVTGEYRGFDGRVHRLADGQRAQYANFSGWDVYRSQLQLVTLLDPGRGSDVAQSLLNQARQNAGVWDRWTHNSGATSVMSGDPSAIAVANFVAFGADAFDVRSAYDSLIAAATTPTSLDLSDEGCPVSCRGQRPSLDQWLALRYIAAESNAWAGAAETLEQSSADFALSQLAGRLGDGPRQQEFLRRAQYWKNLYNPTATADAGYIQDRNADGTWREGFEPATGDGFVEGSAAQYVWMVPFNAAGLFALMGGVRAAVERLDAFFHFPDGGLAVTDAGPLHAEMDNQPSIASPWMYLHAGKPSRAQEIVRATMLELWTDAPEGIPGNDDLGQMSSWFVWSALGMYPLYPGRAELVLGSPLFPGAHVDRGAASIAVVAGAAAPDAPYVHGLTLDGKPWPRSYLPESFVRDGGRLEFTLSSEPNETWATRAEDVPPSFDDDR